MRPTEWDIVPPGGLRVCDAAPGDEPAGPRIHVAAAVALAPSSGPIDSDDQLPGAGPGGDVDACVANPAVEARGEAECLSLSGCGVGAHALDLLIP